QSGEFIAAGNNFFQFEVQGDGSARLTLIKPTNQPQAAPEPAPFSQSYPPGSLSHFVGREQISHDGLMSGRHFEFQMQGIIWHVRDVGSVNGSLLNLGQIAANFGPGDQRRPAGEFYPIKTGDRI